MNAASAYFIPFFIRISIGLRITAQIRIADQTSFEIAYQAIEKKMFGTIRPHRWMVSLRGEGEGLPLFGRDSSGRIYRFFDSYEHLLRSFELQMSLDSDPLY